MSTLIVLSKFEAGDNLNLILLFFFFSEKADNSHEMPSLIFSEK